ncbi:Eco57I restriction-modification methylase domain-containing protein [Hoyosella altamirensis]|uniref:Eco57I restriction-modification methylase domain-containing protein n=1 Tax=Hoyosella altamirensis TaxID=616997 RepID=UPI0007DAF3F6|nr:hypothetical protein [Hoyosella altamirensis]
MATVLNDGQRRHLDGVVQRARVAAEQAATDALRSLAVAEPSRPAYLDDEKNALRLALREKARQLGDNTSQSGTGLTNLTREVAYEQWHRLLFARFLEVNGLLRHPEYRDTAVTLDDCAELADDLDEPDAWSVAARFASEILPGVFRLDDPAVRVRFATEHRLELEDILLSLPQEIFVTEDALGWVYQFWQTAEKKRVNESGIKIGGADLSPVTQLFTENYMVRFLLENSLGAWWAARHPDSPLIADWEYLRRLDDGTPAAGTYDEWPATAAEVTVMDPCCGSGHFLVALFGMLWRMRAEEDGMSPADAQDAVLRQNLHGLELDPRCTQIATFNVGLEAWKQGGFRDLPAPQVACSGVPVRGARADWEALASTDDELRRALIHLHQLFRNADTLGSLIDPQPEDDGDSLFGRDISIGVAADRIRSLVASAIRYEQADDTILGHAADDVVHAADLLARSYVLVATNPPYLGRGQFDETLMSFVDLHYPNAKADLATVFIERCNRIARTIAIVSPQNWLTLTKYTSLREEQLATSTLHLIARLGAGAFREITGEVVQPALCILSASTPPTTNWIVTIDASAAKGTQSSVLKSGVAISIKQADQEGNPDSRILLKERSNHPLLGEYADGVHGLGTKDSPRFIRKFWEVSRLVPNWEFMQSSVAETAEWSGCEHIVYWQEGRGVLHALAKEGWAILAGKSAHGRPGVLVSQVGRLCATLYTGGLFEKSAAVVSPNDPDLLPAVWAYLSSPEYATEVRRVDQKLAVTNRTLVKVPFDLERWQRIAKERGVLPEARTNNPTQWLFEGAVPSSDEPLQVAVARLLGYRWPKQHSDALDTLTDNDGIAALQSLPREPDLATRLRELLAATYDDGWSSTLERKLVTDAGGKNGRLEDWLRDTFFAQHVKIFDNRPFLWHIWDGRKDGFAAIVNYHRLDHPTLEKLTFTTLGAWLERQKHEAAAGRAGADARLAAAEALQGKLKLILKGAPPYDIYVRWKELHEQPIGWHPDLDDGVRLNIRPFVTAGVLRSRVNVHWKKDRGRNPDGSERINDLHPTLDERREARRSAGVPI